MKGRQRCKQLSGNDLSLIVTPFTNIRIVLSTKLCQNAISNYSGQFGNYYPKDPTIKILTSQAWSLPHITGTKPLANAITVYTDGTSKGRAGYIIYSPSRTCTKQVSIAPYSMGSPILRPCSFTTPGLCYPKLPPLRLAGFPWVEPLRTGIHRYFRSAPSPCPTRPVQPFRSSVSLGHTLQPCMISALLAMLPRPA
jgi:hypothetical protein